MGVCGLQSYINERKKKLPPKCVPDLVQYVRTRAAETGRAPRVAIDASALLFWADLPFVARNLAAADVDREYSSRYTVANMDHMLNATVCTTVLERLPLLHDAFVTFLGYFAANGIGLDLWFEGPAPDSKYDTQCTRTAERIDAARQTWMYCDSPTSRSVSCVAELRGDRPIHPMCGSFGSATIREAGRAVAAARPGMVVLHDCNTEADAGIAAMWHGQGCAMVMTPDTDFWVHGCECVNPTEIRVGRSHVQGEGAPPRPVTTLSAIVVDKPYVMAALKLHDEELLPLVAAMIGNDYNKTAAQDLVDPRLPPIGAAPIDPGGDTATTPVNLRSRQRIRRIVGHVNTYADTYKASSLCAENAWKISCRRNPDYTAERVKEFRRSTESAIAGYIPPHTPGTLDALQRAPLNFPGGERMHSLLNGIAFMILLSHRPLFCTVHVEDPQAPTIYDTLRPLYEIALALMFGAGTDARIVHQVHETGDAKPFAVETIRSGLAQSHHLQRCMHPAIWRTMVVAPPGVHLTEQHPPPPFIALMDQPESLRRLIFVDVFEAGPLNEFPVNPFDQLGTCMKKYLEHRDPAAGGLSSVDIDIINDYMRRLNRAHRRRIVFSDCNTLERPCAPLSTGVHAYGVMQELYAMIANYHRMLGQPFGTDFPPPPQDVFDGFVWKNTYDTEMVRRHQPQMEAAPVQALAPPSPSPPSQPSLLYRPPHVRAREGGAAVSPATAAPVTSASGSSALPLYRPPHVRARDEAGTGSSSPSWHRPCKPGSSRYGRRDDTR